MVETELDKQPPEAVSLKMGFDGNAPQSPCGVVIQARQCFPAYRGSCNDLIFLENGYVQSRLFVVAAEAARFGVALR